MRAASRLLPGELEDSVELVKARLTPSSGRGRARAAGAGCGGRSWHLLADVEVKAKAVASSRRTTTGVMQRVVERARRIRESLGEHVDRSTLDSHASSTRRWCGVSCVPIAGSARAAARRAPPPPRDRRCGRDRVHAASIGTSRSCHARAAASRLPRAAKTVRPGREPAEAAEIVQVRERASSASSAVPARRCRQAPPAAESGRARPRAGRLGGASRSSSARSWATAWSVVARGGAERGDPPREATPDGAPRAARRLLAPRWDLRLRRHRLDAG